MIELLANSIRLLAQRNGQVTIDAAGAKWHSDTDPKIVFGDGSEQVFPDASEFLKDDTGVDTGVRAVFTGFEGHSITLRTRISVNYDTSAVAFELYVEGCGKHEIASISWPAPFGLNVPAGRGYTVLPRMQGSLFMAGEKIVISPAPALMYDRNAYMPMYGQVRLDGGAGYLAVFDTPFDAAYAAGEDSVIPMWMPSLGLFDRQRKMSFRFIEDADYNKIAAAYRAYLIEKGEFRTLKEKTASNPNIERVIGAAVVHCGIAYVNSPGSNGYNPDDPDANEWHTEFKTVADKLEALKAAGLGKAYMHLDGWGKVGYDNQHPDVLPPYEKAGGAEGMAYLANKAEELGVLFGIHDQYRDYYYDARTFDMKNAIQNADGSHPFISFWNGGRQTVLCAKLARDYVLRNYNEFARLGINVRAAYLDVFSALCMDECFDPNHPMTREECCRYRAECLDLLNSRGLVMSSEETIACIVPSMALCHHAPFYTENFDYNTEPVGIPIPLFNMVYHDCVVIPWIGTPDVVSGWSIPKSDRPYAHAILNAGPVYADLEERDPDNIGAINFACELAAQLAHEHILTHRFVTEDRRVQETVWSDGTVIRVNLDTAEYSISKNSI